MRGVRLTAIVATCVGAAALVAPESQARRVATPSGTIVCSDAASVDRPGLHRGVVCTITRQSFLPSNRCDGGYNPSALLRPRGRTTRRDQCGVPLGSLGSGTVTTVRAGSRVRIDAVTCRSSVRSIRCTNRDGHGFQLSARAFRRF